MQDEISRMPADYEERTENGILSLLLASGSQRPWSIAGQPLHLVVRRQPEPRSGRVPIGEPVPHLKTCPNQLLGAPGHSLL
jgi:hypothetical protein